MTGRPAELRVHQNFRYVPSWTYILLLFGIFPFFIASMFAAERFEGTLPWSGYAAGRQTLASRVSLTGLVIGIVLVVAGISSVTALGAAGFGILLLALIALVLRGLWSPGAIPDGRRGVELTRVHPRFVEAVRGYKRSGS